MAETAEILGCSRAHIYNLVARGELRRVKLGRRSLIPASEIERLASGQPAAQLPDAAARRGEA